MQTADGLTKRCRAYIDGIRGEYASEPIAEPASPMPIAYVK
jgi:hypothetical protein